MSEVTAEYFDYFASETQHVFQFDQHAVKYGQFGSYRLAVLTCLIIKSLNRIMLQRSIW